MELKDKIQYRIATINFPTGSSSISYKGIQQIKKIVKLAKERNAKIKIVGHASKRTKDMPLSKHKLVNFSISHQRAQTVANLVIDKYSFPSENLITEAVSDSSPYLEKICRQEQKQTKEQKFSLFIKSDKRKLKIAIAGIGTVGKRSPSIYLRIRRIKLFLKSQQLPQKNLIFRKSLKIYCFFQMLKN